MLSRFSIEGAIVTSAAALFTLLGIFLYFIINGNAVRAADEAFDRVLGAAALSIADTVAYEGNSVTVDIPYSAFAILGTSRLNRVFYRVVAPDRSHVTGSPVLALEMPPATGSELRFADGYFQDEPIRIAAIGRYRSDAATGEAGWIDVLVAETREARDQLAAQLAMEAAIPAATIAILAFVLIWIGIRFAFSPLRSVERSLRARSPADLTPIEGRVPREIDAFVVTLNEFMGRLGSTLDGLHRVTSDAAHQLRTPLTAIRAQSEIALEDTDPKETRRRLLRINANAVNASRLANRWLTDATLLHKLKTRRTEAVELGEQIREALTQIRAEGIYAKLLERLDLQIPETSVMVSADQVSIREMLRNLIENAFVHGAGPMAVKLSHDEHVARVEVSDFGPGISPLRHEAVFERFVRDTDKVPGTGLGLAIARDVAEANGGSIVLADNGGTGLVVTVTLPLRTALQLAPRRRSASGGQKRSSRHLLSGLIALAMVLSIAPYPEAKAQMPRDPIVIASTVSAERFAPIVEQLEILLPGIEIAYQPARSPEIAARVRARTGEEPDIVILPSPDMAVSLTNEGLAAPLNLPGIAADRHWRQELYILAHDPAIIAFNKQAPYATIPQTRLELAQLLEQSPPPLFQRIGIVNVGIDSVSYTLAYQDSLRSPLYWRLARAFGAAQARIYDTSDDLIAAIEAGRIDIAYNVPYSVITSNPNLSSVGYLHPQDYAIAVPWVAFAPKSKFHPQSRDLIAALLGAQMQPAIAQAIGGIAMGPGQPANIQSPDLGPELLVFSDTIKRGTFLDTWFHLVTSP
ncbi:sensor histidine kinase N-terminal domain-containing protein [Pelagibacterium lentulum]|uniref:histidine kinase n=1 Tax=Pelagibacterium lentulum TaxID=2029865 RepID=A0A916W337_9HYPH|nr:sensor histidine kinase N-terminal domain-containing protein [Pelagibacterium lentulum]GGA62362.1 hypothetical protein GCM10011499_35900 [Pelagibacterium lentulum]